MTIFAGVDGTGPFLNWQYRDTFKDSHIHRLSRGEGLGGKDVWTDSPFYWRGPSLLGQETLHYATFAFAKVMYQRKVTGVESVVLAGYSRGGAALIETAYMLKQWNVPVEALFLFDAVDKSLVVGGVPPNSGPLDWLDPGKWNSFKGRPIPSNVKHVYHARRHPRAKSRECFGTCGVLLENSSTTTYEEAKFDGTHGGIGGVPWTEQAVPTHNDKGQPNKEGYISEGWPDGMTTVTPSDDRRIAGLTWDWMLDRVVKHVPGAQVPTPQPKPRPRRPRPGGPDPKSKLHTVVAGESLSLIADKYWSDVLLWPIIYDENQATIGSNPNLIQPNWKLAIPDINGYSSLELANARDRGRNWR